MSLAQTQAPDAPAESVVFADGPSLRLPLGIRIYNVIGIVTPFLGFAVGVAFCWGRGFGWIQLSLFAAMYLATGLGITIGYHRLFCHRSFKTSRPVQCLFAILGSMAFEGPVLKWAAVHRCHHQHSDRPGDPHSPHEHQQDGMFGVLVGMWHAHIGWIFRADPQDLSRYVPDLQADKMLRVVSKSWTLWAAVGVIAPALLGGLLTRSWTGVLIGFLWGGLARIFLVHHVTWSVNSVCHIWGSQPFPNHDHSRNNAFFGLLAMGEGWHNNHHAFPASARHGLRWWQFDLSYALIRLMSWLGLAWDVKVPRASRLGLMMEASPT
jgi:stearoyl-CoA desaturase (delta-9 desaturase)